MSSLKFGGLVSSLSGLSIFEFSADAIFGTSVARPMRLQIVCIRCWRIERFQIFRTSLEWHMDLVIILRVRKIFGRTWCQEWLMFLQVLTHCIARRCRTANGWTNGTNHWRNIVCVRRWILECFQKIRFGTELIGWRSPSIRIRYTSFTNNVGHIVCIRRWRFKCFCSFQSVADVRFYHVNAMACTSARIVIGWTRTKRIVSTFLTIANRIARINVLCDVRIVETDCCRKCIMCRSRNVPFTLRRNHSVHFNYEFWLRLKQWNDKWMNHAHSIDNFLNVNEHRKVRKFCVNEKCLAFAWQDKSFLPKICAKCWANFVY